MKTRRFTNMMRFSARRVWATLAAILLILAASQLRAANVSWTNTAGGNWSVAANWNTGALPTAADDVSISAPGNYTVTLNINADVGGLMLGGPSGTQTLAIANRVLTLNGTGDVSASGRVLLSGGAISGTNQLRLAGTMTWQSGAIDTNASLVIAPGGSVTLASGVNHAKLLYGNLTNEGIVTWQPIGTLSVGGALHNRVGGLFEAQADYSIVKSGSNAVIVNDGVFRKSTDNGNLDCYVPLRDRGTLDIQIGVLTLRDGSFLHSGCAFTGAGETRLNAGTHTLDGPYVATNLVLTGGTLQGHGILSGSMQWSSGQVDEAASLTVATNGTLLIASSVNFTKLIGGQLTNAGVVTWQPQGNLNLAGTFHNLPGALFDVQVNNNAIHDSSGTGLFANGGRIRKATGSLSVFCNVPTINDGTIEISAGALHFGSAYSNPSGVIELKGGTFRASHPLDLVGGLLTGWGTLAADVTNAAVVRPGPSNGVLTIQGDYTQTIRGATEFDLAGNTPGVNLSHLAITGAAKLTGSAEVRLTDGFLPSPGMNFPVMTFASRRGEFTCLNGFFLLGHDRRLVPAYSASSLTLGTVAAPDPTNVSLSIGFEDAALVCWPAEFTGWNLFWNTNLNFTDWHLIPEATHRFVDTNIVPEKFYRLQRP